MTSPVVISNPERLHIFSPAVHRELSGSVSCGGVVVNRTGNYRPLLLGSVQIWNGVGFQEVGAKAPSSGIVDIKRSRNGRVARKP
jgi:hypothetical protein